MWPLWPEPSYSLSRMEIYITTYPCHGHMPLRWQVGLVYHTTFSRHGHNPFRKKGLEACNTSLRWHYILATSYLGHLHVENAPLTLLWSCGSFVLKVAHIHLDALF